MDAFDEMIRAALHRAVGRVAPPDDLESRVLRGFQSRRRPPAAFAAAAAIAALGLAAALPGPRSAIPDLVPGPLAARSGAAAARRAPPDARRAPVPGGTMASASRLEFSGPPGSLPPGARAALVRSGLPWRIPAWLPPGLPVRVTLALRPGGSAPALVSVVLGRAPGADILVREQIPPGSLPRHGSGFAANAPADLRGTPAAETRTDAAVGYHFRVGAVQIDVSGPAGQADLVRRIAEALVP